MISPLEKLKLVLFTVLCVYLSLHLDGETVKVDESCGISLIINLILAKGCDFLGVERPIGPSARLDKMTMHEKQKLAITFAELVYNGQWFTPLREALSAFVDKTQENVTGKVRLKLYKGNIIKAGVWSDYSLYSEEIATFGEDNVYNQADSAGFINLYGLPIKVQAQVNKKNGK